MEQLMGEKKRITVGGLVHWTNEGFRPEFDLILRPFLLINVQEGLVIRIQLTRRKNSDF